MEPGEAQPPPQRRRGGSRPGPGRGRLRASIPHRGLQAALDRGDLRETLGRSQTVKATGLALASMTGNVVQAVFVATFAHVLGAASYGSLVRLVTAVVVLAVPGVALQAATAREAALGRLGDGAEQTATLERWARELAVVLVVVIAAGIVFRHQLASLVSVDESWAAAAMLPTGVIWLMLSVERGALSGMHAYKPVGVSIVGEAVGRLAFALVLTAIGLGVTGAFLGLPLTYLVVWAALAGSARDRGADAGGRPHPGLPAPEPRRLPRCPTRDEEGSGRLRRGRHGGEDRDLGGDRPRRLPAARGRAPGGCGTRPAPRARPRCGHRRRRRAALAAGLHPG